MSAVLLEVLNRAAMYGFAVWSGYAIQRSKWPVAVFTGVLALRYAIEIAIRDSREARP